MAVYRHRIEGRDDDHASVCAVSTDSVFEYEIVEGHEKPEPYAFSLIATRDGKRYRICRSFAGGVIIDPIDERGSILP
jgi:hypothetical protein